MKELKAYYKAIEDLTKIFCKKYFDEVYTYDKNDWVAGDIGDVICINDYWFSMTNIEVAIKYNATRKELLDWYDSILEGKEINFKNYLKYYRGFSFEK